ncbi:MAG: metallophosphoesterase family protein, partial [Phycisphaerae bacterium]
MSRGSLILILSLALSIDAAAKSKPAAYAIASRPATAPTSCPVPRSLIMSGVVFEDLDADGLRDDNEPTLKDMSVSDGLGFVRTQADGRFEFELHEQSRGSVFVCTPAGWRASKQFFVIADFGRYASKVQPADIGLVRDSARNTDRFVFVQLSDTHVTETESTVQTMIEDLEVVNNLSDKPTFVVVTGDLTEVGKQVAQFESYARATRDSRYPLYNVVGNHD